MKYHIKIELILISVTSVLSLLILIKLYRLLRSNLVWRVNCWFCNRNSWVLYTDRNSWTCPKCEQYNGFTKDGDYNKTLLFENDKTHKQLKSYQRSPPKNGLCKMCNINQELKVAQLANFVPTSDRKFDEEIEIYKTQLEKAYKLCSPCKKILQMKLYKEKETLLGSKLLESRTPEKIIDQRNERQNKNIKNIINNTAMFVGYIILILILIECYQNFKNDKKLSNAAQNIVEIITGLLERLFCILRMKLSPVFPDIENLFNGKTFNIDFISSIESFTGSNLNRINLLVQEMLGGFICSLQIIGHLLSANKMKYAIFIDFLWTAFMVVTIICHFVEIDPIVLILIKFLSVTTSILVNKNIKTKVSSKSMKSIGKYSAFNNLNKLTTKKLSLMCNNEDNALLDTDDDVSLSKFGLHNITDSSTDTTSPLANTFISGRSFTPRIDSLWSKPKLNSTFCVNSLLNKTKAPGLNLDSVFAKPSFEKYQRLGKDDSDSDLDESIGSLTIGTPKKAKRKSNAIFSLRKFNATPSFVAPTPMNRARPLISPSKLGHSTSWVAGGYWGTEGDRQVFSVNGSRSSSQSSGFESQASSMTQRNVFSHPPSREESVCGDPERTALLVDPFQSCNINNVGYMSPQNFSRVSSPVYPQMQYNSHVYIPQARFAQNVPPPAQGIFATQQTFVKGSMFKPSGTATIGFSRLNSFSR